VEAIPQPVLLIVRFLDLRCLRRTAKDAHASGLDRAATGDPYTCTTLNALAHERVRVRHRKVVDARTWEHVGRFELGHELRHTELVSVKAGALLGSQPPTPKHSRCRWSLRLRLFREEVEFLFGPLRHGNRSPSPGDSMSALGQKQTYAAHKPMSAKCQ
jgi:hypothetical protein